MSISSLDQSSTHHLQLLSAQNWSFTDSPQSEPQFRFWGFPAVLSTPHHHPQSGFVEEQFGGSRWEKHQGDPMEKAPKSGVFLTGWLKGQGEKTVSGASPERNFPDKSPRCLQRVFQSQTEPNSVPFLLHKIINRNKTLGLCKKSGGTFCSSFTSPLIPFPSQVTQVPWCHLVKAEPKTSVVYLFHLIKAGYYCLW